MKKISLALIILLALSGCKSEQEKLRKKQIEVCQEDIKSGKEPTQFCLNLLPEYRSTATAQQSAYYPQPQAELPAQQIPAQSQPQVVYQQAPQPQIIQAPAQDNGVRDMILGGVAVQAINSALSSSPGRDYREPQKVTNVTKNVTVINKATPVAPTPVTPPVVPKKNFMDMSKLNAPLPRPVVTAPVKKSAMNMGKLSSHGKR